MKLTGFVRPVDHLGRVVVPIQLRRYLGIEVLDPVETLVDGDCVVLRKYRPMSVFCGSKNDVTYVKEKAVCGGCTEVMRYLI
ncbi:AbrB/MazE/SpoVT family DNA-binding domain-containing protein [Alicyclobacillus sp. ALC3]|uniref:AbrB/MazE/SpoVT family DNA-binding domain-containing protein n=1 Tax=Alicyclobacillus sp. ALC3 TaxID=2796143 RepID=UPI0023788FE8|nr:AbrB/MazE/SpoVT family DNA-binding domain-containing protein [Alicyclobacillus sp. ALC3]WDL97899.1 AbrB family transcriptional regulator [Alicyclobacillus sp. ALC3]